MSDKQKQARAARIKERTLAIRNELWPAIEDGQLWNRKKEFGWITIPRTLPLVGRILDQLSNGKPLSPTYFALWCRVFDEGMVEISKPRECAFEAGFTGERQESTWISRMRILRDLGFILSAEGPYGEFSYVLLLNPYKVIAKLHAERKIQKDLYVALVGRADEGGAEGLISAMVAKTADMAGA